MSWPSIQSPNYPMGEEDYFPQIKNEFEAGYVQTRPRATVAKLKFQLRWDSISESDYQLLKAAFRADQGTVFSWTHPVSGVTYNVRYSDNSLSGKINFLGHRELTVNLEEAK